MVPMDKCHLAAVAPREMGVLILLNMERAVSHPRTYRGQDHGWVSEAPGIALHLVLMTSHHLVLQTCPVAQGLS